MANEAHEEESEEVCCRLHMFGRLRGIEYCGGKEETVWVDVSVGFEGLRRMVAARMLEVSPMNVCKRFKSFLCHILVYVGSR